MATTTKVNFAAFERVADRADTDRLARAAAAVVAPGDDGAPLLLGPKLQPRDEAIFWLTTAAEIEHALMVQYLFAGYSIDPDSIPPNAKAEAANIKAELLQIAREEMGHFISVQNLFKIVGGPMHFSRQYSPFEAAIQPFRYRLEPVTLDSLAKYVIAEMPNRPLSELKIKSDPAADAAIKNRIATEITDKAFRSNGSVKPWHVGILYMRLANLFRTGLSDRDVRLDRAGLQARWSDWGYEAAARTKGKMVLVESIESATAADIRARAAKAIEEIGAQGEAADMPTQGSHFERFLDLYERLDQLEKDMGRALALPIAPNPNTTSAPQSTGNVPLLMGEEQLAPGRITKPRTLRWAELFNVRYQILLNCLHHVLLLDTPTYDATVGPPLGDRTSKGFLQYWTFAEMRRLKRIAEKLVELPKDDGGTLRAGPPFELPFTLQLPHIDTDRWAMHEGLFQTAKTFIENNMVTGDETGADFLKSVAESDALAAAIAGALSLGKPIPDAAKFTDFRKAVRILDEAVRGFPPFPSPHGPFWRNVPLSGLAGLIIPNDPDGSPVIQKISIPQDQPNGMPKERPRIPKERIDYIRDWVERGAPDNVPPGQIGVAEEPAPGREPGPPPSPPPAPPMSLSFARDIKPLFRDMDRNSMRFRFDLFKFEDVKQNASAIFDAVSSGFMPCDGPWTGDKVDKFKKWMDGGLAP